MTTPQRLRLLSGMIPLVASGRLTVLVAASPDSDLVRRVVDVVDDQATADSVLDLLVSGGIRALPDFAICERQASGFRVVIRGRFRVRQDGEGPMVPGLPWLDRTVDCDALTIGADDPVGPRGAVADYAGGVALVSTVRVAVGLAAERMPASAPPRVGPAAASDRATPPTPRTAASPTTPLPVVRVGAGPDPLPDVPHDPDSAFPPFGYWPSDPPEAVPPSQNASPFLGTPAAAIEQVGLEGDRTPPPSVTRLKNLVYGACAIGCLSILVTLGMGITPSTVVQALFGFAGMGLYLQGVRGVHERKAWGRVLLTVLSIAGTLGCLLLGVSVLALLSIFRYLSAQYSALLVLGLLILAAGCVLLVMIAVNALKTETAEWCNGGVS